MDRRTFLKVLVGSVATSSASLSFASSFAEELTPVSSGAIDKLNTRLSAHTISKAIREVYEVFVENYKFEVNDSITKGILVNNITELMNHYHNLRVVNKFLVVCDDTNNLPSVIDKGDIVLDVCFTTITTAPQIQIRCCLLEENA